ncbi:hypothetical protein BH11PSE5_BH11PSE5_18020 [soil metagenome]|uniref:hypothetical protein n=1 Tax=Sphingobium sp. BS19 TaxID=3018973 RepID=UPI0022EDE9CA|nr:hypothetical protein [Sphingobium sp. BS19]GLI98351.1 hypothetical protein Sbs19_21690 [Sphingobium sp. BS19]
MSSTSRISKILLGGCAVAALSACGANDIASPGTGGSVTINNPAPAPAPAPAPTPTPTGVVAADSCPAVADPQGLGNAGTITGPTGTYRVCNLPARINKSITLPKIAGLLYQLPGRVDVGTDGGPTASANDTNVTLNIDPGVIVISGGGVSWLAVNRGNKISAIGTATQPIIFTSRENALGNVNINSSGQWGGVVLMGRAPVTDCEATGVTPGTAACERQTEGAADPAKFGGATPADSSGRMSYVQIRYSGYNLSPNSELQALTTEGTGSGTILDHIMSYNSSDDAAEFFGGVVNMKYFIAVGAEDDNLDTDTGVKANFQYVIAVQRQNIGDAIIEADSDNAADGNTPRQNTRVANFTFIDRSPNPTSDVASILLRGGTDYTLVNGILASPVNPCLRISRPQTASTTADAAIDEAGAPVFKSVVMQCTTKYLGVNGVTDAVVQTLFGSGSNNNNDAFTPSLTSVFINGANETAVVATDPKTISAFFDTTTYIGAVKDANDKWYQGWTCNSDTVGFGTGNSGLCTSLPTT